MTLVADAPAKGVQEAVLDYRVIGRTQDMARVAIRLHTGRTHQIRVQFSSRGFPLLGDHKYGARDELTEPRLFSCRICFPWGKQTKEFEALPDWM
jgi:23S rRNA pseudouridine1911/1915/1917 synthase